jgi:hypothetical protein
VRAPIHHADDEIVRFVRTDLAASTPTAGLRGLNAETGLRGLNAEAGGQR